MGKHKPRYTPFMDTGDHVIVVNAAKVRLTGRKEEQKLYPAPLGLSGRFDGNACADGSPDAPPTGWWKEAISEAISGMLPKTKLGKQMYRKLKVYAGDKHPHSAQQPVELKAVGAQG